MKKYFIYVTLVLVCLCPSPRKHKKQQIEKTWEYCGFCQGIIHEKNCSFCLGTKDTIFGDVRDACEPD